MTTLQLVRPTTPAQAAAAPAGPTADDLIDQARALEAQALGKLVEASMLLGQREQARLYMDRMNDITLKRRAAAKAKANGQGEEGDRTLHVHRGDL